MPVRQREEIQALLREIAGGRSGMEWQESTEGKGGNGYTLCAGRWLVAWVKPGRGRIYSFKPQRAMPSTFASISESIGVTVIDRWV